MDQNKHIKPILISIVVIAVFVCGFVLVGWKNKALNEYHDALDFPPMVNGKQIMKMTAHTDSYSPEYFKVRSGIPARWEITSSGQGRCANGPLIATDLIDGDQAQLKSGAGQVTVVEFLAPLPGIYKFHCPIGTASGTVESNN